MAIEDIGGSSRAAPTVPAVFQAALASKQPLLIKLLGKRQRQEVLWYVFAQCLHKGEETSAQSVLWCIDIENYKPWFEGNQDGHGVWPAALRVDSKNPMRLKTIEQLVGRLTPKQREWALLKALNHVGYKNRIPYLFSPSEMTDVVCTTVANLGWKHDTVFPQLETLDPLLSPTNIHEILRATVRSRRPNMFLHYIAQTSVAEFVRFDPNVVEMVNENFGDHERISFMLSQYQAQVLHEHIEPIQRKSTRRKM